MTLGMVDVENGIDGSFCIMQARWFCYFDKDVCLRLIASKGKPKLVDNVELYIWRELKLANRLLSLSRN